MKFNVKKVIEKLEDNLIVGVGTVIVAGLIVYGIFSDKFDKKW